MASIELHVSLYPTVWHVVLDDETIPAGMELVDSVWATEHLAKAAAYTACERDRHLNRKWTVVQTTVGLELKD